jgi:hypothetical protein
VRYQLFNLINVQNINNFGHFRTLLPRSTTHT